MNSPIQSVASVITGAPAFLLGSAAASAQATVDTADHYPNVGAIMVWRVDGFGKPVELRGFAGGTLIRPRVMITAGHFTAPVKALGKITLIRIFASFSPTDARDPATWIPVIALATHPSMPHCPPPPKCDPTDEILVAPLNPALPTSDSCSSSVRRPMSNQPCLPRQARSSDPRALIRRLSDTASRHRGERWASQWTHGHGTVSGASGPRPFGGSSMKPGDSTAARTAAATTTTIAFTHGRYRRGSTIR